MSDTPLLIIDEECAFCRVTTSWYVRHTPSSNVSIVAAGSLDDDALRALGLTRARLADAVSFVDSRGTSSGADAVRQLLATRGRGWRVAARIGDLAPLRTIAQRLYRVVARHRKGLSKSMIHVTMLARALRAGSSRD